MEKEPESLEAALHQFTEIKTSLDVKKTLQWELSLAGLKSVVHFIDNPQTQHFVEEYLLKVVNLMTSQSPSKLGSYEKNTLDQSIELCLKILCALLPQKPKLLNVLARIFDQSIPYYHGVKIGYTYSPGYPLMRAVHGKRFVEMQGLQVVRQLFNTEYWPGGEVMLPIVKLFELNEVLAMVEETMRLEIARTLMAKLLALSDENTKKESAETLTEMIKVLNNMWSSASPKNTTAVLLYQHYGIFYKFWMSYIAKLIKSSSLVLKLFGWEQVNELIVEAKNRRPDAASYIVSGAGSKDVNGVYVLNGKHGDTNSNRYVKAPSSPNEPYLTLFRCTMRTKAKWWFISIADLEKPGTDKDIDYYLHRSLPEDEKEPPPFNWVRTNTGINLVGEDPCPVVKRHDVVAPPGMTKSMFLDAKVVEWCVASDMVSSVFGASIHREIVSRSGKLLVFLAENDIIDAKALSLIWKAAMTSYENDIVDEIFSQLVQLSIYLSADLFAQLIRFAIDDLSVEDNLVKVAQFAEKFAKEGNKFISSSILAPTSVSSLSSLLWQLFIRPSFDQLKACSSIQDLLSVCYHRKGSIAVVHEKILECKSKLVSEGVDGAHQNRIINILQFLISKHCSVEVAEQLIKEGLLDCFLSEIRRFVLTSRNTNDYIPQLASRLKLLRKFMSITSQMTLESVEYLWSLLHSHPLELDELFQFLKISSAVNVSSLYESICSPEVSVQIFGTYICSPQVDWSTCGAAAVDCFHAYFSLLENHLDQVSSMSMASLHVGLDTLWRIVLNIQSVELSSSAVDWLIQAYDNMLRRGVSSACSDLLQAVFVYLTAVQIEIEEKGVAFHTKFQLCIRRCVRVIHCAILKWKGVGDPSHAIRSCMSRINILVYYRRVSPYYSQTTHSDMLRVDKGFEGSVSIEVHPFFSVLQLKERIVKAVPVITDLSTLNIDNTNHILVSDANRLFELDISDGSTVHCSYQSMSYLNKSYEVNDSVISDYYGDRTVSDASGSCVGQLLAENYSWFDCLLTLCELTKTPEDNKAIWDVLMLCPTQIELYQQTIEQVLYPELAQSSGNQNSWNSILENCPSITRTAYLLQIIDIVLQPSPEFKDANATTRSKLFKSHFIASGGFEVVLKILIATPTKDNVTNSTALAVALHIIHFLLFGVTSVVVPVGIYDIDIDEPLTSEKTEDSQLFEDDSVIVDRSDALLSQIESVSNQVIEKLLLIARHAADKEESSIVQNALLIITNLIKAPEVASQLINNGESKTLLCTVLRSSAKKVREMASDFAIQVGRSQPVVFGWLVNELLNITEKDNSFCSETFVAIGDLLLEDGIADSDVTLLADIISEKCLSYINAVASDNSSDEPCVLLGYLELLNTMLKVHTTIVLGTKLGVDLVSVFVRYFLFTLPSSISDNASAICVSPQCRQSAFAVLASYCGVLKTGFEEILKEFMLLTSSAAKHFKHSWSIQIAHEVRQRDLNFCGLKNQGCTCYMNSLLQLLFMSSNFRESILATPLPEHCRSTLWHRADQDLVGLDVYFAWSNGSWRVGKIVDYLPDLSYHVVEYYLADGTLEEAASFNIREGRYQKETGKVRLMSNDDSGPISEREESAYRVLEQLQRTFCFMKLSNRRYFDPRPFVDACKTLNLNFNVYYQNDAAEFCDQLLDRVETATKGKHSNVDAWNDELLKKVFGGKWLYQKIPRECEAYDTNKIECGHFQGSRLESFLKVELMIRGKEKIDESLEELVQGELMDGDNKISCDVCGEKKATVRRTCFGVLPNTLILHLKRFDLDFQTFETVKLNNKLSFPSKINLFKYTKEGIEAAEKLQQEQQIQAAAGAAHDDESPTETSEKVELQYEEVNKEDTGEHEYELQGVLVHAGVAQGGHYYSFIRDDTSTSSEGSWYRFDDDVVSSFNPDNIPAQCYGGPVASTVSSSAMHSSIDEDRSSNAFMLLYNKVNKGVASPVAGSSSSVGTPLSTMVTGTQAFEREVQESNLEHTLSVYLIDPALHSFVRGLVDSIAQHKLSTVSSVADDVITRFDLHWHNAGGFDKDDDLPLRIARFYSEFLMDVVLHCRERAAMRSSVGVLINVFEKYPHTAHWFVSHVLNPSECTWFLDYLMLCSDALARASFVQLLVQATIVIAPKESNALRKLTNLTTVELRDVVLSRSSPAALCALLVRTLMESVIKSVNHIRTADEIFVLIRDLAASIPCICNALQSIGCVSYLSYFSLPADQVPVTVRSAFESYTGKLSSSSSRVDYGHVLQSVFEAMAALLGVPQIRKINLLQERSYFVPELVVEAKEALSLVFLEATRNGVMDTTDAHAYFDKVNGTHGKMTAQQIRHFMERYSSTIDGKLNLDNFLQYHTDNASLNPKLVWRDLHAFGFKNNLMRMTASSPPEESFISCEGRSDLADPASPVAVSHSSGHLHITDMCRDALSRIALYESGMSASEASTRAIAVRCCLNCEAVSVDLLVQALIRLKSSSMENSWNYQHTSMVFDFIKLLLGVADDLTTKRLHTVIVHPEWGLASVAQSERANPSKCRANEYNKWQLFDRYVGYVQDLISIAGVLDCLNNLSIAEPSAQLVRGYLRLSTVHNLTENELHSVKNTTVSVDGAGVKEVNGEYHFVDVKNHAGYYERQGQYNGSNNARFTLYKCSLKNGGFQWFLSLTPDDVEPGTTQDVDFYYVPAKGSDKLPTAQWHAINAPYSPAPTVSCLRDDKSVNSESSKEDENDDCSSMIAGDDELIDTSFISNGSDVRDFYD